MTRVFREGKSITNIVCSSTGPKETQGRENENLRSRGSRVRILGFLIIRLHRSFHPGKRSPRQLTDSETGRQRCWTHRDRTGWSLRRKLWKTKDHEENCNYKRFYRNTKDGEWGAVVLVNHDVMLQPIEFESICYTVYNRMSTYYQYNIVSVLPQISSFQ